MSNSVPKLNPLNIDYGVIITAAEKRRDVLADISNTLQYWLTPSLDGLKEAHDFYGSLSTLWDDLDPEGRTLLPKDVRCWLQAVGTHKTWIQALIGTESNLALESLAHYGISKPDPTTEAQVKAIMTDSPLVHEAEPTLIVPPDTRGDRILVEFMSGWNVNNWPEGAWVCRTEGESYGVAGVGANPTSAYNDWLAKQ